MTANIGDGIRFSGTGVSDRRVAFHDCVNARCKHRRVTTRRPAAAGHACRVRFRIAPMSPAPAIKQTGFNLARLRELTSP